MMRTAAAHGAVVVLARVALDRVDHFLHRLRRKGRIGDQEEVDRAHRRHRSEVLERIDRRRPVQRRADAERRARRHQQRVTVGRLLRHELRAHERTGAGLVLDHDRLLQRGAEPLADRAGEKIGQRARRIRDDELDRPRWIGCLRRCDRRDRRQCEADHGTAERGCEFAHGRPGRERAQELTGATCAVSSSPCPAVYWMTSRRLEKRAPWSPNFPLLTLHRLAVQALPSARCAWTWRHAIGSPRISG